MQVNRGLEYGDIGVGLEGIWKVVQVSRVSQYRFQICFCYLLVWVLIFEWILWDFCEN